MAEFQFKSFQEILADMVATFLASGTGVNDINPGSVLTTFLEAASGEDSEQYYHIFQTILNYNLNTTTGDNLEQRAVELGLTGGRLQAGPSSGFVTISDSAITKVQTSIYAGSRGPVTGQTFVDVDDASDFDASGSIIIGRNTNNVETIAYSSITNFTNFYRFNLATGLSNDHGVDETVILSQGGNRIIESGTVVNVPASDISDSIQFVTLATVTILDGESQVEGVAIQSVNDGSSANVAAGTISQFENIPFPTALVENPSPLTNGRDRESDDELRDRIKNYIQSLSRGTKRALSSGVIGISNDDGTQTITSSSLIDAVTVDDIVYLYIDDGTGLEPSFAGIGQETIKESTTGGEKFLQLNLFPIIKAQVETQNSQPFNVIGGDTLIVAVNGIAESITFQSSDFVSPGEVTGYEIVKAINDRMTSLEARTLNQGAKVVLNAIGNENESIQVVGGTAFASNKLAFSSEEEFTLDLYRSDLYSITRLSKDGITAAVESGNSESFALFGGEVLNIVVDGKTLNPQTITFQAGDFVNPGSATAEEVVTRINLDAAGITSYVNETGSKVIISSNTLRSASSKIRVTGGTANTALNFSTTQVVGANKDYTLNRFNGKIELEEAALAGEKYEAGSSNTRGFLVGTGSQPFSLTNGDTISFSVDGGATKVATFSTADFVSISNATAQEIVDVLNRDILGITSSVVGNNQIRVMTNTWSDASGSIEVVGVTGTATALGFTVGQQINSLDYHTAFVESVAGPFSFNYFDELIVVLDKDAAQSTFSTQMNIEGVVTVGDASAPYNTFIADILSISQNFNLKFPNDDAFNGFYFKWTSGSNTGNPATTIANYDASTGTFQLTANATNTIDPGDEFHLVPITALNVVTFLGNTAASSLSSKANISLSSDGTKVQIESKTLGLEGAVQVAGGSANDELQFSTGLRVGRDGYEYYTGIIQKVQWTIDGLDSDLDTYPGIKAAGEQVQVSSPVVNSLRIEIDINFDEDVEQAVVKQKVSTQISSYINSLGVGQDVILNDMIETIMEIDGVVDAEFIEPNSNIAIADNEIARVASNNIIVG